MGQYQVKEETRLFLETMFQVEFGLLHPNQVEMNDYMMTVLQSFCQ